MLEWRWLWHGQVRHDCSDISGGASGSPLIDRASGAVTAVIGTTNVGNAPPSSDGLCGRNDPCELRGAESVWRRNSSYATATAPAALCFDAAGVFDLAAPGCGLDPGTQARVFEQRLSARPGSSWNTAVTSGTLRYFRYKTFAQGEGDCAAESGYGRPEPIPGRVSSPLPEREGRYFLCVTAGVSPAPDATWQPARFASVVPLRVDGTPPAEPPRFDLIQSENGFTFIPRSSLSTGIAVKADEAEFSTCADLASYRRIYPAPWFIPRASARRLCLSVEDGAGNSGSPAEVDLTRPSIFPDGVFASAGYEAGKAAPGSWIGVFGVNLVSSGVKVALRAGGGEFELEVGYASIGQVNARIPDDAPLGPAEVIVSPPGRESVSAPLTIRPAVPGIFTADARPASFGAIAGIRSDGTTQPAMICSARTCEPLPFENIREFTILAGGLGNAGPVTATFAEQPVEVLGVEPAAAPGVDAVRVRMPPELRLRGYIPVRIGAGESESGPAYVWLR